MSSIRKLAGQTMWYGLSNVAARFLNYLLTFLHVQLFATGEFGNVALFYANAALLSIVFTYGMETAFFRFAQNESKKDRVYSSGFMSLLVSSILLSIVLIAGNGEVAGWMRVEENPEWITWLSIILAADTLAALPFALLRQQNKPRKYAFIKIASIVLTIGLQLFFFLVYPDMTGKTVDISYVFLSNLIASVATLLLLWKELLQVSWKFDKAIWKEMFIYALPLLVVGFGGMINEMLDRMLLQYFYPGTLAEKKSAIGIYSANYKLAILIVLFIQAFRMGAEPFFFQQAADKNAPRTYARVMKFFVIACCFCFLVIVLFLDLWKSLITTKHIEYGYGIMVVPILALAKLFLGIYYNLSIWYKLTDRNLYGAYITFGGVAITVIVNIALIPVWGYFGSALATLLCYGFMMISSYVLGQKYYPIPYAWKKLLAYIVIAVILFGLHELVRSNVDSMMLIHGSGLLLFAAYLLFIARIEKNEFSKMPLIGRFFPATPLPQESAAGNTYP
jgi:O-antigen/teichoic acid export membrane protein